MVPFTKMHGCGNDYIYVDASRHPIADPAGAARQWSCPHTGIGSDGLVLIGRSPIPEADFTMRIFNADGSEALMCGNASRCIGKYVYERGLTDKTLVRLLTATGIKVLTLNTTRTSAREVASVTVDMEEPAFDVPSQFTPRQDSDLPEGTFVSMGNPHYVIFVADITAVDVAAEGARLERHPQFPERCNIEFAEMRPDGIRMRVWERGSGVTQACGTGACATAVAAARTGRAPRRTSIIMDGGTLNIEWLSADRTLHGHIFAHNHVLMTGPAAFVFDGEIALPMDN